MSNLFHSFTIYECHKESERARDGTPAKRALHPVEAPTVDVLSILVVLSY